MLNITEQNKIKGFIADEMMSGAVKKVLREAFIKERVQCEQRVHGTDMLAAERVAQILLEEGFKELEKQVNKAKFEEKEKVQVGL